MAHHDLPTSNADQKPTAAWHPPSPADVADLDDGGPFAGRKAPAFLRLAVPVLIVTVTFLAFIPALDAGFVDWDDDDLPFANTRYQLLSGANLKWMFTTSCSGHFQPLTWLSYWLDYAIWGRNTFGMDLTNVSMHALAAVAFNFLRAAAWRRSAHQAGARNVVLDRRAARPACAGPCGQSCQRCPF